MSVTVSRILKFWLSCMGVTKVIIDLRKREDFGSRFVIWVKYVIERREYKNIMNFQHMVL